MGYLHEGHLSLIRASKKENDITIVSIYVNPTQFGANEDFNIYPRDYKRDYLLINQLNVNYLFYPNNEIMYPIGYSTFVDVDNYNKILEGEFRPTHFRGVTTIVAKLLNITQPTIMYLGQKDAQQAFILTKMCQDLNFDCKIKIMPIIRDENGLALSSRNVRLNKDDYQLALQLNKTLKLGKELFLKNHSITTDKLLNACQNYIKKFDKISVDYIACRSVKKFDEIPKITEKCYLLIAAKVGNVRLIDNIILG